MNNGPMIIGPHRKECPLCRKPWREQWRGDVKYLICLTDIISMRADDPLQFKWEELDEKIECINCRHVMRFFCRSDGAMKFKCPNPKCGASMMTDDLGPKSMGYEAQEG